MFVQLSTHSSKREKINTANVDKMCDEIEIKITSKIKLKRAQFKAINEKYFVWTRNADCSRHIIFRYICMLEYNHI